MLQVGTMRVTFMVQLVCNRNTPVVNQKGLPKGGLFVFGALLMFFAY
jgi:hypothetical protein